ncbi:MAG: APC family permease [Dactylosporangium sp.]|nr:APC family permease [Dactylosporangium sp.]NNJ62702.1 APC family permease [Dactylosporangium sp.]
MSNVARTDVAGTLAQSRLGVFSVIGFALTAAAPLMVVGGVVTTGWAVTGTLAFSLAFVIMAAVLSLFSIGYVAMARHVTNAGSFYTYLARGLSRRLAVGGSLVQLLAYNLLQVGLYGIFGASMASLISNRLGQDIPWWTYSLAAWAIVAALGVLRVDVNSKVLAVALAAEILVVVVFDLVFLANPAGGEVSFAAFSPGELSGPALGAVLVTVTTAYVGFEGGPVYSEESKDPRRTVPAATYLSLCLMACLYAVTAWAMSVAVGSDKVVATAQEHEADMMFRVAADHLGGSFIVDLGHVLLLTSIFAGLLSFHSAVARASFALGRERVLPAVFGRTHAQSGSPMIGSIVQSGIAFVVVIGYALAGADPLVNLFFWLGMTGGLGVLILLTATSFAVLGFFAKNPGDEPLRRRVLAPGLAGIALLGVLYLALTNYASLLGVDPDSPLRWMFPATYGLVAVIGVLYGQFIATARPEVHAGIGFGANAISSYAEFGLTTPSESTTGSVR